jgi:hypothetical protein
MKIYDGPVVFVDGVHYPAGDDGADLSRPLRWSEGASYRDAEDGEPLHNDIHHESALDLEPGSED